MGTSLTGLTPATTYDALIKVGDNGALSATAKYLSDGLGNDSPLAMSTTNVGIGTTSPASLLEIRSASFPEFRVNDGTITYQMYASTGGGEFTQGTVTNHPSIFRTNSVERMRITSSGEVCIGLSIAYAKSNVSQTSAARITALLGNNNSQGTAQNYRVVRQYSVVSVGTKLIIPFVSQGNLNSNTIVRIFGHSARYNDSVPLGFTADFTVGHLGTIISTTTLSSTGNISGIASSGSNVEITFTTGYGSSTASGIYVTIEYMTNEVNYSIDVANIAMN